VRNFRDFFIQVFKSEALVALQVLRQSEVGDTAVDLHDLFHRFTLDSFVRIGFGKSMDTLHELIDSHRKPVLFARAFDQAQRIVDFRFVNPLWRLTEWMDGSRTELREHIKILDDFANDVVKERLPMVRMKTIY
jgi:hypothetical protein